MTERITDSLGYLLLGNSVEAWLVALAASAAIYLVVVLLRGLAVRRLGAAAKQGTAGINGVALVLLRHVTWWFMLVGALFAGTFFLTLPPAPTAAIRSVTLVALLIQAGIWAGLVINLYLESYRQRRLKTDPASVTTLSAIALLGKIAVWAIVALVVLDNLGVNVTALVAGLGVGGIAVALAVQNILGDLLASLSIVLDKPFVVGDFIAVDDLVGNIEHVGLKTTRVRSLSGEQLVFSNSDLLKSRIRNYGRMYQRRVVFAVGVTYQTPREKVERIPGMLRSAVESQDDTRFDRAHFKAYGDSALQFEVVYFVLVPDYNRYMDIQQAINLQIMEQFEQEGIEFAYPTRTVWLQGTGVGMQEGARSARPGTS